MTSSEILRIDTPLDNIGPGGRIGLIALATDFNSERDLRRIFPDDIEENEEHDIINRGLANRIANTTIAGSVIHKIK